MGERFPAYFQPYYNELAGIVDESVPAFLARRADWTPKPGILARINYLFDDSAHARRAVFNAVSDDNCAHISRYQASQHEGIEVQRRAAMQQRDEQLRLSARNAYTLFVREEA